MTAFLLELSAFVAGFTAGFGAAYTRQAREAAKELRRRRHRRRFAGSVDAGRGLPPIHPSTRKEATRGHQ